MNETVTIPKSEYDRLCALEEELSDIEAALAVEARIARGEEELIPASVVDRLIDGAPPASLARVPRTAAGRPRPCLGRQSRPDRRHRGRAQQRIRSHPAEAGRCAPRRRGRPHPRTPAIAGARSVTGR